MNWLRNITMLTLLGLGLGLAGCASSTSGGTYSRGQVGDVGNVESGRIVSARIVKIEGTKSGVGTVAGAAAGGAAGSQIGGGRAENIVGGIAGAVVGGLAGAAVEEGVTRGQGVEYVVQLDSGRTVSVVQGLAQNEPVLPAGARVRVIYGERARVVLE